ncbi:hypothetical protein IQ07DRAFT_640694 [Pyrenochaeta sp. DS3sAY3a]|nr:hypothetical protein IQ07DRAFT_640694 [Pyrenochaeta sp. DS3sAY3a]
MGPPPYQTCMLAEELRFYVLRDNVMVPLVPVDQMPFQVQGIPRQLSHRQMSDENWKFLAEVSNKAPTTIAVQDPASNHLSQPTPAKLACFHAPDHQVRAQTSEMSRPPPPRSPAQQTTGLSRPEYSNANSISTANAFASIYSKDAERIGYRLPYPSGNEPDPSKKEYCTHWLKTGECSFISVGCKYKHEMPSVEKLREIGFTQGVPRWWKEKNALGTKGMTWMQRRLADGEEINKAPGSRTFTDPSALKNKLATMKAASIEHERHIQSITPGHHSGTRSDMARDTYSLLLPMEATSKPVKVETEDLIDLNDTTPPSNSLRQAGSNSITSSASSTCSSASSVSSYHDARGSISEAPRKRYIKSQREAAVKGHAHKGHARHRARILTKSEIDPQSRAIPKQQKRQQAALHTVSEKATSIAKHSGLEKSKYAKKANGVGKSAKGVHKHSGCESIPDL